MIPAQWRRYEQWKAHRDVAVGRTEAKDIELARAWCGRNCGDWVASKSLEDIRHGGGFRLRRGFVHREANDLPYGYWELSSRGQKQRQRALLTGESLRHWQPRQRGRLQYEEYMRAISVSTMAKWGVIGRYGGALREGMPGYKVDPNLTGGMVVIICPNCRWRNGAEAPDLQSLPDVGY